MDVADFFGIATGNKMADKFERTGYTATKLDALIFDQFQHGYYVSGEQVGKAWNAGAGLMKK